MLGAVPLDPDAASVALNAAATTEPVSAVAPTFARRVDRYLWVSSVSSALLLGPLAGFAVGVIARAWMRLVANDPEFTWSGTVAIVAVFTTVGALKGLALAVRLRGWRPAAQAVIRVLAAISIVLLAPAQGLVMFPALAFMALAMGRRNWSTPVRVGLVAVALIESFVVAVVFFDLPVGREILGWFLMVVLYAAMALALSVNLRPLARSLGNSSAPLKAT